MYNEQQNALDPYSNLPPHHLEGLSNFDYLYDELAKHPGEEVEWLISVLPFVITLASGSANKWNVLNDWREGYFGWLEARRDQDALASPAAPFVIAQVPEQVAHIPEYSYDGNIDISNIPDDVVWSWVKHDLLKNPEEWQALSLEDKVLHHAYMKALYGIYHEPIQLGYMIFGTLGLTPEIDVGLDAMGEFIDSNGKHWLLTKELSIDEKRARLRALAGVQEIDVVLGAVAIVALPNDYLRAAAYANFANDVEVRQAITRYALQTDRFNRRAFRVRLHVKLNDLTPDYLEQALDEKSGLLINWLEPWWLRRIKRAELLDTAGQPTLTLYPNELRAYLAGVPPFAEYWDELKEKWYTMLVKIWKTVREKESQTAGGDSRSTQFAVYSLFLYCLLRTQRSL